MSSEVIHHVTWHMALVPCVTLAWLQLAGQPRDVAWWWLGGAFLVSWLADAAAYSAIDPWLVSLVYPMTQAGIIALVFLPRHDVPIFIGTMLLIGVGAALWQGVRGPDVLLRTVAWGTAAGIVADRWELGRLRTALLVTFGVALLAWYAYAARPGWWTWGGYQAVRAIGIALFSAAAVRPVALTLIGRPT